MRVLYWYCETFAWTPTRRTLDDAPAAEPGRQERGVVAFVHVEPGDVEPGSSTETKLVKNAKWIARKWDTPRILLHSFTHLGEAKAQPAQARALLDRAQQRLISAGYEVAQTPYGHFNDLHLDAPGHPLARIYKEL